MRGQSAIYIELAVHTKQVKEDKLNISVCRDTFEQLQAGFSVLPQPPSCQDLNLAKTLILILRGISILEVQKTCIADLD